MNSYIPAELRRETLERAHGCCEYCLVFVLYALPPHEIDHVIAEKHQGKTVLDNLCLGCYHCNRRKGADLCSIDPETDEITRLFNPRLDDWGDHFHLEGAVITPLTPVGRTTVSLLQLNNLARLVDRTELIAAGHYPCQL